MLLAQSACLLQCATQPTKSSVLTHSLTLLPFLVTPGLQLLASGAKDCEVRVWDPRSGACLGAGAGHIGAVAAVALARSKAKAGSFLVSAGADKLLKVWDTSKALEAAAGAEVAGRLGFYFGGGGGCVGVGVRR